MQDLITCVFTGRTANQAFQIAAVVALATKHNVPYSFPKPTDNDPWKIAFTNLPNIPIEGEAVIHNENVGEYKEIPYNGGVLVLDGFFQSYKYFEDYKKEVFDLFGFEWKMISNRVSIHVRRGDYVAGSSFEPITINYISDAIDYFYNRGYFDFVVFSDDIDWCKENINSLNFLFCEFEYSEGRNEFEDINYMSSCAHNIISNSTFAWWSAFLNQNPDKIVIAPVKWFDGVNKDLIPTEWIRI